MQAQQIVLFQGRQILTNSFNESCLPWRVLQTNFNRITYKDLLIDISKMAIFINRLLKHPSGRPKETTKTLFTDNIQYLLIEFALQKSHCYLVRLIQEDDGPIAFANQQPTVVDWNLCNWNCCVHDNDCQSREITVVKHLQRLVTKLIPE